MNKTQEIKQLKARLAELEKQNTIIIDKVEYELDIWMKAYPKNSKLLEKFAKKLIFELEKE